ncbi:Wzz/FepE/Etk N-terminal domain-containing protein [Pseudohaliea sp.]|uniref:Wzz/FepE/Etk N-terminal domain-containing protein n=1 Tax=Pseudohaliea sp. TaxID=2740289 RepID=UPI0032ED6167
MNNTPRREAMPPAQYPGAQFVSYDDEIDLLELGAGLWHQRLLILATTAAAALLALLYLLIASPEYLAEARLRPPTAADLRLLEARSPPLLVGADKNDAELLTLYAPEASEVFKQIIATAQSNAAKRAVFDGLASALVEPEASAEERSRALSRFLDAYAVAQKGVDQRNPAVEVTLEIAFRNADPTLAANAVNQLIRVASSSVVTDIVDEFRTAITSRITSLRAELKRRISAVRLSTARTITQLLEQDSLKRAQLEDELAAELRKTTQARADRITALRAALAIARSLDIEQPTNLETLAAQSLPGDASILNLDAAGREEELLFLRGTVMLEAELRELEAREDDKPYTALAREIEKQLQLLEKNRTVESLRARKDFAAFAPQADEIEAEIEKLEGFLERDFSELRVARIDQVATPPTQPVAPRKRLVLAAAVVLGLMLGVVAALIRNAVLNRREPEPG